MQLSKPRGTPVGNYKLLVIDDSQVIRARVREMLPPQEYEVLEASDGIQGLDLVHQERPDLIMLDFLLPRLSGWEVFQQLQQPDLKEIPLVVMSGRKEEVIHKIQEPFLAFEFIEKPFEQKQLLEAIQAAQLKAQRVPVPAETKQSRDTSGVDQAEVKALNAKVTQMQAEIDTLKKAMGQLVTLMRQQLK